MRIACAFYRKSWRKSEAKSEKISRFLLDFRRKIKYPEINGRNVALAKEAKSFINIPVITVGRITDPQVAEDIVLSGSADFIAMGRASLTDPQWSNKLKHKNLQIFAIVLDVYKDVPVLFITIPLYPAWSIRNWVMNTHMITARPAIRKKFSSLAPESPELKRLGVRPSKDTRLSSIETQNRVGGQFISAAFSPHKGIFARYSAWLAREIEKYDNITLHLNTKVSVEEIKVEQPDKVIVATGAKAMIPNVVGIDGDNVVFAEDLLLGKAGSGQNVLVVGGGMIGTETSLF
ncbi:MAG: FAD-dependent oxidoreductase [Eubacteriaceae bacterium]|jgi:tRNA-dihydrouridine synthase|nr:FAD-dependent oxidoreductase [Eubacteriaceae bacterium]